MTLNPTRFRSTLQKQLFKLHASGPDGFEGFVRDAFVEATGISPRIQKSGMQGGVDTLSDGSNGQIAIGVEAKRYRETTTLALDDLKKKLFDAATRSGSPIEFWILVASKEVSADDVGALEQLGDELGIGVLVLDWRSSSDVFASLPLLLALAPNTVERVLGRKLAKSIRQIEDRPEFAIEKADILCRINHPGLGRLFAAQSVRSRIAQTLQSRADSRSRLQNSVDLGATNCIWTPRDNECAALEKWSKAPDASPVCAVVGDEGAGKTWLLFDWWRRETERDPSPLFVWFAARDVTSGSLADVLGAALAKWVLVPSKPATFWAKRVQRWRQAALAHPGDPFIWLMLDGTNEGTAQPLVKQLLAEAADSDWRGAVRIMVTDRPSHWQSVFKSGHFLEPHPANVTLSHFSDVELDTLLARHHKTRNAFSAPVLNLIRWPSWFAVAAEMFDREHNWTAHSAEQLMLRYVQHRLGMRLGASMNDATFRDLMSGLGRDIQRNWDVGSKFSRAELKSRLSGFTGEPEKDILQAVDEITSGVWFRPSDPYQFEIDNEVLPLAIGLALHGELKSLATEEEVDSRIERFLGQMEDQSIGVNVLASTVSLTFLDPTYPAIAIRVLLRHWITSHNFSTAHFQLLWRIGSVNPQPLLDVAESIWMQRSGGTSVDEILIKSIANVGGDGGRQAEVIAFLARSARTYWLDPRDGQFINYDPKPQQRADAIAATQKRLNEIRDGIGAQTFAQLDLIQAEDGVGASWLFYRCISITTYLPRAAQTPIWRGWALSRAVMGRANHFDDLAWSLRVNPIDGLASTRALLRAVDDLLAFASDAISERAYSLLEAEGGLEAAVRLTAAGQSFHARRWSRWQEEARLVDGIVTFQGDVPQKERHAILLLSNFAIDPDAGVSAQSAKLLRSFAKSFPVLELGNGRDRTSANLDLDMARPALARWAPKELVALYRRFLMSVTQRDEAKLLGYTFSLSKLLILLTPQIQKRIRAVLIKRRKGRLYTDPDQIDRALIEAVLFGSSPREQIDLWNEVGAPRSASLDWEHLLRTPSNKQIKALGSRLAKAETIDQLAGWLAYLKLSKPKRLPINWSILATLLAHEDASIRELVFSIALHANDSFLAKRHLQSPWVASNKRSARENACGALLLARFVTPKTFAAIVDRTGPECSAIPWHKLKYQPDLAYAFEGFLKVAVERELNPPPSRTFSGDRVMQGFATRRLVEQKPIEIAALADMLFAHEGDPAFGRWEFPRMDLMEAFLAADPAKGAQYWTKLRESDGPFKAGDDIKESPFEAKDGDVINELRKKQFMEASNDWELLTLSSFVVRRKRIAWAISLIKELLAAPQAPSDMARAIMIAGFLDDSEAVRTLWNNELAKAPLDGWIGLVYRSAKDNIEKTWTSLAWLDRALTARDDVVFFVSWELFAHYAERNTLSTAAERINQKMRLKRLSQRQSDFVAFEWRRVYDAAVKAKGPWKDNLFSFKTGHQWAKPWVDG